MDRPSPAAQSVNQTGGSPLRYETSVTPIFPLIAYPGFMSDLGRVAIVVPCHNEEDTIGNVIRRFRQELPGAIVVVADNGSTDDTALAAREAGAQVIFEPRLGKGEAVRRLLADIDADYFVLIDGDDTMDSRVAPEMLRLVSDEGYDMVVGKRVTPSGEPDIYRRGHRFGNKFLTWVFQKLFKLEITDTLSGYRVMSRRFVKSFPASSVGFEIEAELNAHAAVIGVPLCEVPANYVSRPPESSQAKLSTFSDGTRILRRNLRLFRDARPSLAFSLLALPWLVLAMLMIQLSLDEFLINGEVIRSSRLLVGIGSFLVALLLWMAGIIMERITRNRNEVIRLAYLAINGPLRCRPETDTMPTHDGRTHDGQRRSSAEGHRQR